MSDKNSKRLRQTWMSEMRASVDASGSFIRLDSRIRPNGGPARIIDGFDFTTPEEARRLAHELLTAARTVEAHDLECAHLAPRDDAAVAATWAGTDRSDATPAPTLADLEAARTAAWNTWAKTGHAESRAAQYAAWSAWKEASRAVAAMLASTDRPTVAELAAKADAARSVRGTDTRGKGYRTWLKAYREWARADRAERERQAEDAR